MFERQIHMNKLSESDNKYLDNAKLWVELGSHEDAENELWQISPCHRQHPDFLDVWWHILFEKKRWADCEIVARKILTHDPSNAMGYIQLAETLLQTDGVQNAYNVLIVASDIVDDSLTLKYNLACFSALSFRPEEAKGWLAVTFAEAVDSFYNGFYQQLAVQDLHLKTIWKEIPQIENFNPPSSDYSDGEE